jgi:hypothetical protein
MSGVVSGLWARALLCYGAGDFKIAGSKSQQTRKGHRMDVMEKGQAGAGAIREDEVTKGIESYTAAIPSSAYLAVAAGALGLSLFAQLSGRGKWGNFIAQWVPTWLILGLYNKVVKTTGHG